MAEISTRYGRQWRFIAIQCCRPPLGKRPETCVRRTTNRDSTGCVFGNPPTASTYAQAVYTCRLAGLYLCRQSCINKGCNYNGYPVWTRRECDNKMVERLPLGETEPPSPPIPSPPQPTFPPMVPWAPFPPREPGPPFPPSSPPRPTFPPRTPLPSLPPPNSPPSCPPPPPGGPPPPPSPQPPPPPNSPPFSEILEEYNKRLSAGAIVGVIGGIIVGLCCIAAAVKYHSFKYQPMATGFNMAFEGGGTNANTTDDVDYKMLNEGKTSMEAERVQKASAVFSAATLPAPAVPSASLQRVSSAKIKLVPSSVESRAAIKTKQRKMSMQGAADAPHLRRADSSKSWIASASLLFEEIAEFLEELSLKTPAQADEVSLRGETKECSGGAPMQTARANLKAKLVTADKRAQKLKHKMALMQAQHTVAASKLSHRLHTAEELCGAAEELSKLSMHETEDAAEDVDLAT
uniref:Uncharacterized protein n=1 Tax=Calcidiscus leptoporus TaxID=127549 RepID=A0A7S0JHG8_9EUKA